MKEGEGEEGGRVERGREESGDACMLGLSLESVCRWLVLLFAFTHLYLDEILVTSPEVESRAREKNAQRRGVKGLAPASSPSQPTTRSATKLLLRCQFTLQRFARAAPRHTGRVTRARTADFVTLAATLVAPFSSSLTALSAPDVLQYRDTHLTKGRSGRLLARRDRGEPRRDRCPQAEQEGAPRLQRRQSMVRLPVSRSLLNLSELVRSLPPARSEKVIEPEEPLALRLSSNLMMGIARVFSQQVRLVRSPNTEDYQLRSALPGPQYTIYASDVQQAHAALKKVVSDAVASA